MRAALMMMMMMMVRAATATLCHAALMRLRGNRRERMDGSHRCFRPRSQSEDKRGSKYLACVCVLWLLLLLCCSCIVFFSV